MTDVRLTATNPEDSSVVPVACNAKGELKLEEPTINSDDYVAKVGDNMTGALTIGPEDGQAVITLNADGSARFVKTVTVINPPFDNTSGVCSFTPDGLISSRCLSNDDKCLSAGLKGVGEKMALFANGSAVFAGDVVVGSRNKQWMIVESGGIAHLVEQTLTAGVEPAKYPALRNIPQELDLVEQALSEVMEKLRMNPPAGWPVWDGSDED